MARQRVYCSMSFVCYSVVLFCSGISALPSIVPVNPSDCVDGNCFSAFSDAVHRCTTASEHNQDGCSILLQPRSVYTVGAYIIPTADNCGHALGFRSNASDFVYIHVCRFDARGAIVHHLHRLNFLRY